MKIVTLKGKIGISKELSSFKEDSIIFGKSIIQNSPSDVLDSPLNPSDISEGIELVKVIFETASAGLAFYSYLVKILKEKKEKATVETDNKTIVIDGESTPEEIVKELEE